MLQASLPILLIVSVVTSFVLNILRGSYSKRYDMSGALLWNFNFLQNMACFLAIALIYLFSDSNFHFSLFSAGWGLAMAAANVLAAYSIMKAYALGTFAYTSVIVALSAVIPTLSGLFFGETIKPVQYLGIVLMVVCILLSSEKSAASKRTFNVKWLWWCAVAYVSSGSIGVIQKAHQYSPHATEMPALLLTAFAVAAIVAFVMTRRNKQRLNETVTALGNPRALFFIPLLCGACFAFPHTVNLVLAGQLPSVIMFPVVNLCPMMLSMVFAFIFLKERLSATQWLGLVVGVLSTVLVSDMISI